MHVQTDADATIFTVTLQLIVGPTEVGRSVHVGLTSGHEGSPCLDRGAKGANAWGPQLSDAKTPQHAPNAGSAWSANKGILHYLLIHLLA